MGWNTGSILADELWYMIKKYVNKKDHRHVAHYTGKVGTKR